MPTTRRCYRCGTVLATEKKKMAKLITLEARPRSVEVCHTCWWTLIGKGFELKGKGKECERLGVTVEQRELFAEEKKPEAAASGRDV